MTRLVMAPDPEILELTGDGFIPTADGEGSPVIVIGQHPSTRVQYPSYLGDNLFGMLDMLQRAIDAAAIKVIGREGQLPGIGVSPLNARPITQPAASLLEQGEAGINADQLPGVAQSLRHAAQIIAEPATHLHNRLSGM
jgi:hypothetical protein